MCVCTLQALWRDDRDMYAKNTSKKEVHTAEKLMYAAIIDVRKLLMYARCHPAWHTRIHVTLTTRGCLCDALRPDADPAAFFFVSCVVCDLTTVRTRPG